MTLEQKTIVNSLIKDLYSDLQSKLEYTIKESEGEFEPDNIFIWGENAKEIKREIADKNIATLTAQVEALSIWIKQCGQILC